MPHKKNENPYKTNLRLISIVMFIYVVTALAFHDLRGPSLPGVIGPFAEIYTLPLRYMYRPLFPLLKPFGLVVSDGAELPTAYGIVVGSVIYVFVLLLLSGLLMPPKETKRKYEEYWDE